MLAKAMAVFMLALLPGALFAATPGERLAEAAKTQIGVTLQYDSRYQQIAFPGGDVPMDRGVCSDVVIRAFRALGVDLQLLVHQDMQAARAKYPNHWQLSTTDTNIDHRRVPNLSVFFSRHGQSLTVEKDPKRYLAGDLVVWRIPSGLPHIGIVASERSSGGVPLVIHNIGRGTVLENRLFDFTITGHYRYLPRNMKTG